MNVTLELSPYAALEILAFLKEFVNDEMPNEYQFAAIRESVAEYENEIYKKVSNEMLNEALEKNQVYELIGKSPKRT